MFNPFAPRVVFGQHLEGGPRTNRYVINFYISRLCVQFKIDYLLTKIMGKNAQLFAQNC